MKHIIFDISSLQSDLETARSGYAEVASRKGRKGRKVMGVEFASRPLRSLREAFVSFVYNSGLMYYTLSKRHSEL